MTAPSASGTWATGKDWLQAESGRTGTACLSPDGKACLSGGIGKVFLWEVGRSPPAAHLGPCWRRRARASSGFLPGGREFLSVSDTAVRWFAVDADKQRRSLKLEDRCQRGVVVGHLSRRHTAVHEREIESRARIRAASGWNCPRGKVLARIEPSPERLGNWVERMHALSPDGQRIVVPAAVVWGQVGARLRVPPARREVAGSAYPAFGPRRSHGPRSDAARGPSATTSRSSDGRCCDSLRARKICPTSRRMAPLPEAVASGRKPFWVGAIAGG